MNRYDGSTPLRHLSGANKGEIENHFIGSQGDEATKKTRLNLITDSLSFSNQATSIQNLLDHQTLLTINLYKIFK